jgi:uncharacterized protein
MPEIPAFRFRPHHFLCFLVYGGAGYTEGFVASFDAMMAEMTAAFVAGLPVRIELVNGPDSICAPLFGDGGNRPCNPFHCAPRPDGLDPSIHCYDVEIQRRDALAYLDLWPLFQAAGKPFAYGKITELTATDIRGLRAAYRAGTIRKACADCSWKPRCDARAADGFMGARLAV